MTPYEQSISQYATFRIERKKISKIPQKNRDIQGKGDMMKRMAVPVAMLLMFGRPACAFSTSALMRPAIASRNSVSLRATSFAPAASAPATISTRQVQAMRACCANRP